MPSREAIRATWVRHTFEGSRDSAGILLHAALTIIGASGFSQIVEASYAGAGRMAESIRTRSEFQLLVELKRISCSIGFSELRIEHGLRRWVFGRTNG